MRWLKRIQCRRRGYHDFKWSWLDADSVYEIDIPECDCGAYKVFRWKNQTEYAKGLGDANDWPDREEADEHIYYRSIF